MCLVEYLWEVEGEVCDQVSPRGHVEPELPPYYHQVGYVGLVDWEARFQLKIWRSTGM